MNEHCTKHSLSSPNQFRLKQEKVVIETHMCPCTHSHTYRQRLTHVYVCICEDVYSHIDKYIQIHTYIHTYIHIEKVVCYIY